MDTLTYVIVAVPVCAIFLRLLRRDLRDIRSPEEDNSKHTQTNS